MVCPECKNKGYKKNERSQSPHRVIKTVSALPGITLRWRVCLQCGYRWETVEKFERPLKVTEQGELFDSG